MRGFRSTQRADRERTAHPRYDLLVRHLSHSLTLAFAVAAVFVACGSRTGLLTPTASQVEDGGPLFEGGPLDASIDCSTPSYCVPDDPGYVYQCGVRVYQCSSLEQCEERPNGDSSNGLCVNPC